MGAAVYYKNTNLAANCISIVRRPADNRAVAERGLRLDWANLYLIGFFDCALQKLGQPIHSDEEFAMLLLRGHEMLLERDVADIRTYVFASMRLQDAPLFAAGQSAGGNDCNDLLTGKSTQALTLARYLMERVRTISNGILI